MSQPPRPGWSDERVELVIGNLLRYGVLLSALVVLAGGVVYLAREGRRSEKEHRVFRGVAIEPRHPAEVFRDAFRLEKDGLIELGLLLLIATPVVRVLFSVAAFAGQRDRTYVVITLLVLGVLLYSLFSDDVH